MRKSFRFISSAIVALAISGSAFACIAVDAGPIWNQKDAESKCPNVCSGLKWNGQWTTTQEGVMSVCGTTAGVSIPVGPIWDNDDAKTKCQPQLKKARWNGTWTTTEEGKMSVCGCNPPPPVRK